MRPTITRQIIVAVGLLAVVAAIAFFGSLATMPNVEGWYADAEKVPWNPPDGVFGPAWTTLYIMIAAAGFFLWRRGFAGSGKPNKAKKTLWIYTVQLALNASWTPAFFAGYPVMGEPAWWIAAAVIVALIASVIWLIADAAKHSKLAAWLLVPYLLWIIFASTLNIGIIALN